MTKVHHDLTAFLAENSLIEGRMVTDIRETLTLLMCADCSTLLCIFFASGFNGEIACHSQEQLKPCGLFLVCRDPIQCLFYMFYLYLISYLMSCVSCLACSVLIKCLVFLVSL